jgi:transmembrane sensor
MAWLRTRRIRDQAAAWHVRMQEPQSPQDVAAFDHWLRRDPAHPAAYAEIDSLFGATGKVRPPARSMKRDWRPRRHPALALAAVVALVSLAIFWSAPSAPAFAAITNEGPAIRGVRLEDGTVVWLDVGSQIGVRFGSDGGEIKVHRGRVRIIPQPARPLDVSAGSAKIAAAETTLDVSVTGTQVTVAALDGPLAVSASGGPVAALRLATSRAVTIDASGAHPVPFDRSWPASRLRFDDAPLARIITLANAHGDPDIRPGDPAIAALRVSGVFDLRETPTLARKLAAALDLHVDDRGTELVLRR